MNSTLSRVESMVGTTGKNSLSSLMDGFSMLFVKLQNPEQSNYYDTLIAETGKFTSQVSRLAKTWIQWKHRRQKILKRMLMNLIDLLLV